MKNSLILPVIYLFVFLILTILLTGFNIVIKLAATMETSGFSVKEIPVFIKNVIPVSGLLSLLFLFIRILKKPGMHFLSFVLPLATAFCALFFGIISINTVITPVEETVTIKNYIKPNKFLFSENNILYISNLSDNKIDNAIYIDTNNLFLEPENNTQMYQFIDSANVEIEDNKININTGRKVISLDTIYSGYYSSGEIMETIFKSISSINKELSEFYNRNITEFAILCFSFVFIIMSSNVFMRITRWPLFNFFVVMFISIGAILLYNFLKNHIVLEFFTENTDSLFLRLIPCISLLIIGVLFLFIDIIFIPFNFWDKEIENA